MQLRSKFKTFLRLLSKQNETTNQNLDLEISRVWGLWPDRSKNPLTRNPKRYFSQSDEDGIIERILIRLACNEGTILEFGVGDGSENNSLSLISKGWKSYWVGAQELIFNFPESNMHSFRKTWITLENIDSLYSEALGFLNSKEIDIVSMDLDGNDYHFVKRLLEREVYPKIWICEYNASFPPGANWIMPYNENHIWNGDNYFGASFSAFVALFRNHRYFPVACSVQGANVFFIREKDKEKFIDVDLLEEDIYQPPLYFLPLRWGHKTSPKTLDEIFKQSLINSERN